MLIVAVLIDLAHTYISHEAKKGETLGNAKNAAFFVSLKS
jgi:hypothetical protein